VRADVPATLVSPGTQAAKARVTYLVAALAAPIVGALLYRSLHGRRPAARLVDGFVYLAVPVLVAIQVVPDVVSEGAPLLLAVVAAGALVPNLLERASRSLARHTDDLTIVVTLTGLVVHEALEGAALAPGGESVDPAFAWAVILHRVPVGLVMWWLVRPRHGIALASAAVASLSLATLAGAFVGYELAGPAHGQAFKLFEAFVAGTLLHVVFHQGRHDHDHSHPHAHAEHSTSRSRFDP